MLNLPEYISPSAAKSYLGCSLRFYFERVAGIKKPTSVALHLGKSIHSALQAFHLARWRGEDDSPEFVAGAFEKAFLQLERDEGPVNFGEPSKREKAMTDGLRVVAAYLASPEALKEKPRAVEVFLKEEIPGLSVPLTGAMDLVEQDFTPIDFKSAAAKPNADSAILDHEIQLVSYQLLLEAIGESPTKLDLIFLVKTKTPQVIRISSPPADEHRKRRVTALLEIAVTGIASERFHPQPGMHCSWCSYRAECAAWLPS
ncbi:RecB family exonuclease [Roseibacillus persicicus]|uniref:RecB family exonuclease n=1 Tax=Roseibacillus persicicus TaxID=454148 RepID=UPI00280EFF58|nr:PD-(D/E)XK nuclease family protein [Roseibacillus persicicus]MDQ8192621.1 PD-(D/E)XK nuclease family protein [Roseibacillus persicicus]